MTDREITFCMECHKELVQYGHFIACYYSELCNLFALTGKPVKRWNRAALTSSTLVEYLEKKGFIVTHESGCGHSEEVFIKPIFIEDKGSISFCKCTKKPGIRPGSHLTKESL